jgi:hypothetical protein
MRLVAVDARQGIDVGRVMQTLSGTAAVRVFLFGAAARAIASHLEAEERERRDRFIDDTAQYLMSGEAGPRPQRGTLPAFVARLVAVVPTNGTVLPVVPSTDRAVEMRGTALAMALPRRDMLARENVENAALWLLGGSAQPEITMQGASIVLAPGPLDDGGVILVCEFTPQGTVVEQRSADGALLGKETITPATTGPRFSVRG